jgi:hypothetical protein
MSGHANRSSTLRLDALSYPLSNQRADHCVGLGKRHRLGRRSRVLAGVTGVHQTAGPLMICRTREPFDLVLRNTRRLADSLCGAVAFDDL